ncbi:MAG: peptidoglycan DD-metalloendopeptidase family protein [Faecalibacterium sp.]|nr:peptidoglycan DD-metalloendopeptidase family protein [Ruminococcus sp.]MCM1393096.1 peptidoglycan DD-metalloendopeptidase family protein [Ruminococcus sp.]MCM1486002.1 peptidoglycan DD-metalloendopeptidase family protein [Faecalibacterium sp.]
MLSITAAVIILDEETREALRRERRDNKENIKKESSSVVTVTQIVLSIILAVVVFFTVKGDTDASKRLRADFERLMSWSWENSDAQSVMKTVKDYLSSPFEFLPAFSPATPPETSESETEVTTTQMETTKADDEITEENSETATSNEPEETTSEKAEPEAMKKSADSTDGKGGEDISYKAQENTSFAPVATTAPIVAPVSSTKYTSQFGYRINPITNERSFHTGLDIAAPLGTKIRAAYAGTVRKTGEDSHSGKYIFLTHSDGFETFYCHCSEILAEQGAVIRQGETIALVGSTGWSTGPHLHFEIRKDGTRLNPLWVLEGKEDDS